MADRKSWGFLIPLSVFLAVTATTGTIMVGAHIIAATTSLAPVAETQGMSAAAVLCKIVGPGLMLASIVGGIGLATRSYVVAANHNERGGDATPENVLERIRVGSIACVTAFFAGMGFTIVGSIEPMASSAVQDVAITTGFFAALAVLMIIFDRVANKGAEPTQAYEVID